VRDEGTSTIDQTDLNRFDQKGIPMKHAASRRSPTAPKRKAPLSRHQLETTQRDPDKPDFVALGLGGTNMMAMLWAVAMGRNAIGVEMRGDPFLGVHWNIREDLYHQLHLIDQLMLERYGAAQLPRRGNGDLLRLTECFYSHTTRAGDIVADEIIDGYDLEQHIVGTIHHVEYIDDRWDNGQPRRVVTELARPAVPEAPDATRIRDDMRAVLDGPSTFQAGAASILVLLRRYLEQLEALDLEAGRSPRVRMFIKHRVLEENGFVSEADGRLRIRIEELCEIDYRGRFVRQRMPGTDVIDLGVPELFSIAQGFHSSDAEKLGFKQHDVVVDHGDGRGGVVAQADYIAGLLEVLVDGRLRRRIASSFDTDGREYWVRQIAVGHENDPEVGWVLVQVPDYMRFDPIERGLVPSGTNPNDPSYLAAYQHLLHRYFLEQVSLVLEIPVEQLERVQMVYGPKLFSLVERIGDDACVAPNGVVAGDTYGNGHFMTSGGAMTGMIGHSQRFLKYWQNRADGLEPASALRTLANAIHRDTEDWLAVSAQEFSDAIPINFGAERGQQIAAASGIAANARAHAIDAARRARHSLIPLDASDWRRLVLRNGRVVSQALPPLMEAHPALRESPNLKARMAPNFAGLEPRPSSMTETPRAPLKNAPMMAVRS
jgi:hypothetical protein